MGWALEELECMGGVAAGKFVLGIRTGWYLSGGKGRGRTKLKNGFFGTVMRASGGEFLGRGESDVAWVFRWGRVKCAEGGKERSEQDCARFAGAQGRDSTHGGPHRGQRD